MCDNEIVFLSCAKTTDGAQAKLTYSNEESVCSSKDDMGLGE